MTTPATARPAEELDELVRRTPGVDTLYRSGSLLGRVVTAGRQVLGAESEAEPYVRLAEADGTTTVAVTIGVKGDSAVDACRAVHDAIAAWLREHGHPDTAITVTVAHVAA